MKTRLVATLAVLVFLAFSQSAHAQWSSDPAVNLPLADTPGADQVQPKIRALPNNQWWVSWFDSDPNSPPPAGYDVYVQRLDATGVEQFPHGGIRVANLTNSSTQDYGLDFDTNGFALLAFLDTREGSNEQVTAVKVNKSGKPLWGLKGVQLTADNNFHADPKITGTSDGGAVVGWTSNSDVVLQKLDKAGVPVWAQPLVLHENGFNYVLSDLHAAENGSVILSWERDNGFSSNHQLRANKVSSTGQLLWGSTHVVLFDVGSLQFGEFPYFVTDGSGGAVFAWYTSSPSLQVFAQHIHADGSEAFPHNGSAGSTNTNNVRVEPSVSYRKSTDETFLFWTEEDANQVKNGVFGQKFNGQGASQWSPTGKAVVSLGADQQSFVKNVQIGSGALVFWVDSPGFGSGTLNAARLDGTGAVTCAKFPVSTAPANRFGLFPGIARSGLSALAWSDDRIGNNSIYIQNVNSDCTLGQ